MENAHFMQSVLNTLHILDFNNVKININVYSQEKEWGYI